MGIISWLKNKTKNKSVVEYNDDYKNMTLEEVLNINNGSKLNPKNGQDVLDIADSNSEQIAAMKVKLKECETEYTDVTIHLTDIEIIDGMSYDNKAAAQDCARQIINLNKERTDFKNKERKITDAQYRYLEQAEDEVPEQIKKLNEQEKYRELVIQDLRQIEGERSSISYEKEYALDKREFIKKFLIGGCVIVTVLFMIIFLMQENMGLDLNLPFFLLGILALALIGYSAVENRNMLVMIKNSEAKMNKLITISNKVKIKYVNTESTLGYLYEKYHVDSSEELKRQWEEYVKIKDEEERLKKNTDLLEYCCNDLILNLKMAGVQFPEIWTYQPEALLDNREMVEVRHRLNNRRQKLRDQIDLAEDQIDRCQSELNEIRGKYPEHESEIENIMMKHGVIRGR